MARPTWMSSIQWEIESLHTASTASTFESFPLGLGGRSPSEEEQQSRIQRWRVEVLAASPSLGREAGRQERVVTTGKLKIDFISSNPPSDLTSSDTTSTQPARKPLDALQTASAQHLDTTMAESPGSPKRPTSAISVISDDNEGNEPPRKKAKLDDATHKTNGNMTASTYRMPAANLPAPKHANLLHPPATSAYAMPAPNKVDLRAHVPNGQGPPVISPAINDEGWVEDTMTVGLHYLDQIRNNPQLRIDETLRKLLLDPLPAESKPFKVCDPHNIPPKLYEYFYILTFHTNKVLAVPCIWLDLCKFPKSRFLSVANHRQSSSAISTSRSGPSAPSRRSFSATAKPVSAGSTVCQCSDSLNRSSTTSLA